MIRRPSSSSPLLQVLLLATLVLAGCAPLRPNYAYQSFGAADPRRDRKIAARMDDDEPSSNENVVVLLDTLPEGIRLEHGVTRVEAGWQHQVLGKVTISPNGHASFLTLFGFPDYRHVAFKAACYPQTILNYATLTLWSFLSPTAYPCWGRTGLDEDDIVEELRKAGATAGGNLVVASLVKVPWQTRVFGASGIVLRADPRLRTNGMGHDSGPEPPQGTSL